MSRTIGLPIATRRRRAKEQARLERAPKVLKAFDNLKTLVGVTSFISDGQTGETTLIAHYEGVLVAQAKVFGREEEVVEADLLHARLLDYVKHGRRS